MDARHYGELAFRIVRTFDPAKRSIGIFSTGKFEQRPMKSKEELRQRLIDEWKTISLDYLKTITGNMRPRYVIEAKGYTNKISIAVYVSNFQQWLFKCPNNFATLHFDAIQFIV